VCGRLEVSLNDRARPAAITLSIAAVERDTGLSKDTLRVWERRYGFPNPGRDPLGERAYTLADVEKLRIIKRLLDAGHRPGRVVTQSLEQLQAISEQTVESLIVLAIALTASKSPLELAANPASMTSTRSRSSCLAMRIFSSRVIEAPGLCSPSRNVVSKMISRSMV
jgi:hypothetical protein